MTRLLIHVEGETEEAFVNDVLRQHLYRLGYTIVGARIMGSAQERARRGGIVPWAIARQRILNNLRADSELVISTMVDYYGMPNDWPGRANPFTATMSVSDRAEEIENALLRDVSDEMGSSFNPDRFIPYVMMHEFEAMLFSDCQALATAMGRSDLNASLQAVRNEFNTPEEIDDSPTTAPSKRIEALLPAYQKPIMGVQAAQNIGLDTIRNECPHFAHWLHRLESLP